MAPTKPLVAQQIEACYNIMGVPQDETAEMTGNVSVSHREKAWKQKRVFFLTPQVMSNDLSRGLFPADHVKLLVVDEAHRAQGEYAYCLVVRELQRARAAFRVVALSATPGTDLQAVRLMLQNLVISRIELRSEESPDIVPYTFQRKIEKIVVKVGKELEEIKQKYLTILEVFIRRLAKAGVLSRRGNSTNPLHYTKFGLIQTREEYRQNPPARLEQRERGILESDFACAMSLYHGYDLLIQHGMRPFYNFMLKSAGEGGDPNSPAGSPASSARLSPGVNRRLRYDLMRIPAWTEIMMVLKEKFSTDLNHSRLNVSRPQLLSQFGSLKSQDNDIGEFVLGHPKLEKLRETVIAHFQQKKREDIATRVMIFSQYRDSVTEITAMLHRHKPLIKVMEFVGQSGTGGKKGLSQKEQIEVVKRFKEGGYNTLVATCVGEEGLDIGEVDLIVCYDVSKSPIRLVQRMGRTGRKREGRIIVLVTEGKEEQSYNQSMYCKNSINKAILEKEKLRNFLSLSPRMVPNGIDPVCHKMVMSVGTFVKAATSKNSIAPPEKNKKITSMMKKMDKASTYRRSCGFLTNPEMEEYLMMYPDPEKLFKAVPHIRQRRELWASSANDILDNLFNDSQIKTYDLSEWNMWQNSDDQGRFFVTKSKKSELFCNILNLNDDKSKSLTNSFIQVDEIIQENEVESFELDERALDQVDEDQSLYEILGPDDPYRKKYNFANFAPDAPSAQVIDDMLSRMDLAGEVSLKEALESFRAKRKQMDPGSPVFLSPCQHANDADRETSTPKPALTIKGKFHLDEDVMTPVPKRANARKSLEENSAFEDSFVYFSNSIKEEPEDVPEAKSLYGATQLASMLGSSEEKKIKEEPAGEDLFAESGGHFDSFLRDLSEHETSARPKSRLSLVKKSPPKPVIIHLVSDFEIVGPDFFEALEAMFATEQEPQFKMPNLEDYETRAKITPKAKMLLSQSPIVQGSKAKRRAILSSSEEEEDEEEMKEDRTKKRPNKKKRANKFIDDEAELSGSASDDEHDHEQDDLLEASFVDDATQHENIDQQALYLKSIKSPINRKNKLLKPLTDFERNEIFSQAVTDSMMLDEYEEDSFVVNNDEVEYESSATDELDFVEEFEEVKKPVNQRPTKVVKRKRIVVSSSEDDEEQVKKESSKLVDTPPSALNESSVAEGSVTILVNAAEVHKSQEVISLLRYSHALNVNVHSKFEGAGYLLSTRLAICRVNNSDFCNGAQRHKIVNLCQSMNESFERPFLIVELAKDNFLEARQHRTKYVDMIISQLCQSNIRVLFSKGSAESASIIAILSKKECKKGFNLPVNLKLSPLSERYLPFYLSLPGANYALALQMALHFKSPKELVQAALATIVRKLKMDEKRALKIHSFCRSQFQPDMTLK